MRGLYLIQTETSDGDRAIAASIDIEGLRSGEAPLEIAKLAADEALAKGGVYKVRVIHDDGWSKLRVHASRIAGLEWR